MGMYDRVVDVPVRECPHCGASLTELSKYGEKVNWQTKDGPCDLVELSYTTVSEFYAYCTEGCWIFYQRKGEPVQSIEDFKLMPQDHV